jgi:sulfate adenylyltransferase subunit 1
MDLLRFTTAGSVDDGKSTLIGRLLYDSKSIFEDQLEAIERLSESRGGQGQIDLALLTDGLRSEREQGITIDVAYRYFATPRRKFIVADTPGHIQYTRNMVTGASTANLAIILIDARKGILEQTHRHSFIASLLHIKHLIVCVNKMDLVGYSEEVFDKIVDEYKEFASRLDVPDIRFIPVSALQGDNVVDKSANMPWYDGAPLLSTLETTYIGSDFNHVDPRFPIQSVIRPQTTEWHDYRGFAGRVASGVFKPGDEIVALPSGFTTRIKTITTMKDNVSEAFSPMSVAMTLEDEIDISRGDMLAKPNNIPTATQDLEVMLCWFHEKPLLLGGRYFLRHTTRDCKALIKEVRYKIDINTLHKNQKDLNLGMNEIGRVKLRTTVPLFADPYSINRNTGGLILIDPETNNTVGAGMIL